jgi:hypothetical protein
MVWLLWSACVLVFALQAMGVALLPKSVSWDPSYGILAAQQYEAGLVADYVSIKQADSTDLDRDKIVAITWWSPSYQGAPWVFRRLGFSWSASLRWVILLSNLTALSGWAFCFHLALRSACQAAYAALLLVSARHMWNSALSYDGGDQLLLAAVPWMLIINIAAFRSRGVLTRLALAAAGGAAAAALIAVKYSGVFVGFGVGTCVLCAVVVRRSLWTTALCWMAGVLAVSVPILIGGWFSRSTPISAAGRVLRPLEAVVVLGNWTLGFNSLDRALVGACDRVGLPSLWTMHACGLMLAILVVAVAFAVVPRLRTTLGNMDARPFHQWILLAGVLIGMVDVLCLSATVLAGSAVSTEPRLSRVSGLLILPAVVAVLVRSRLDRRLPVRTAGFLAVVLMLVIPLVFGNVTGAANAIRRSSHAAAKAGGPRIVNEHLSQSTDPHSFREELRQVFSGQSSVLVVPHPQMMFDWPDGRCVIREPYRSQQFMGWPMHGVGLLVPSIHANEEGTRRLKAGFVSIPMGAWKRVELKSDTAWVLFVAIPKSPHDKE